MKIFFAKFTCLVAVFCILPMHILSASQIEKVAIAQYKIGIVVGSLRKDSYNAKIAKTLIRLAPTDFSFKFLKIDDLPLYNQDDDANQEKSVKRLKAEIAAADGILFVTPEYNWSIPGVLKNAIDHASRPYTQNSWKAKPAGIIGASVGRAGTATAQQHLHKILACLDMPTMTQPAAFIHINEEFFDQNGDIGSDGKVFLQKWMNSYISWIKENYKTRDPL